MKTENKNWKTRKLGELADYINGKAFKPTDWKKAGLPIIRIQNLTDETKPYNYFDGEIEKRYLIDDGDLLISWSATLGSFIWKSGKAVLNQHIFKVNVNDEIVDKEFLHYLILNKLEEMTEHTHGLTMKHITKGKFENIEVKVPPLEEQLRIVGRIKECLTRVDEIKQLREESRKEASRILESGIEDLLKNIAGEDKTIGDVVSIDSILIDPREEEYLDLLHVGGANIVSGTGELIDLKTAREENLISGKFIFTPGNVVYSKIRPYLRKVIRPDFQGICSADIYPLNPNTELITADYLFYLLLSRDFTNYANIVSNRAGMPKVNRTQLFAYEFKLPDLETQNEITAKLDEMRDTSLNLAEEFRNTREEINKITDSILRKAFAGEL